MNLLDGINNLSDILTIFVSLIASIMFFIKPVRKSFIKWIVDSTDTKEQNDSISEIISNLHDITKLTKEQQDQINMHAQAHVCTIKNRIVHQYYMYKDQDSMPELEKKLLIEHYYLYHDVFKQNHYIESCYNALKNKPTY